MSQNVRPLKLVEAPPDRRDRAVIPDQTGRLELTAVVSGSDPISRVSVVQAAGPFEVRWW